jgi:hypothetical protein
MFFDRLLQLGQRTHAWLTLELPLALPAGE